MKRVVIIDYGLGNLFSVKRACEHLGMTVDVSCEAEKIREADGVVLPGVGAFRVAMSRLNETGMTQEILTHVEKGKPFLGICLGLQLLFTHSDEFGGCEGLNLVPGNVRRIPTAENRLVPHVGWSQLGYPVEEKRKQSALRELSPADRLYFVHSFHVVPDDPDDILATCNYAGYEFVAAVQRDAVMAVQFHPEKSGPKGISIYQNWLEKL